MSIYSLPLELLLEIFSLTVPDSPSPSRKAYDRRQVTLRSLSLVQRSWTRLAQALLRKEVWLDVKMNESKKREFEKLARMRRKGFEQVVTIRHKWEEKRLWYPVAAYAEFRYLEALHLDLGKYHTEPCKPQMTFHKLERLMLGNIKTPNWPHSQLPQHGFDPTCMPKLKHLALWRIDYFELVLAVLPQITTLAIIYSSPSSDLAPLSSLTSALPCLVNLKHLSHFGYDSVIPELFGRSQDSQFESLHLSVGALQYRLEVASELVNLVKRQEMEHKKGKIVIYGSKPSLIERVRGTTQLDMLEWRKHLQTAPFEYFDGQ